MQGSDRRVRWAIAVVWLVALLAGCGGGARSSSSALPAPSACLSGSGPFVRAQGSRLMLGDAPLRLAAATIYPDEIAGGKAYRGSAWLRADFPAYIRQMLDLAAQVHLNTIRATDFLNAAPDWRTPQVWLNLDSLICQAQARGMHVIISLTTFGNRLYKQGRFPYNPADWQDYLTFVGQRYRASPAIAYYAIAGEALPPNGHDPLRPTADQLISFYRATAATLAAADGGNHLISTGGLSFLNGDYGIPWQTIFALPHIALAAIHVYSTGDRDISLPMVAAWAAQNGKPFILEEFGFRQSLGDAARAAAFADIFQRAQAANAAGIGFWNLGPEVAPQSYDVSPVTPLTWQVVQANADLALLAKHAILDLSLQERANAKRLLRRDSYHVRAATFPAHL
jgi:hypothetical protein